jgi:anti-sigma regulatory factor (Ser/Thr protein kinase)
MAEQVEMELPFDASAPRAARDALRQWELHAEADVVVSELVTNAILHGAPPVHLLALRTPEFVHVEVLDARPELGLGGSDHSASVHIVEAFADDWGVHVHDGDGKTIWAEFAGNPDSASVYR